MYDRNDIIRSTT